MHPFLQTWSEWRPGEAPHILSDDRGFIRFEDDRVTLFEDWREVHSERIFGQPGDQRLHLGLLPHPFCGDLQRASIYFLLQNPGVGLQDHFGESRVPEFRSALLQNLKQDFRNRVPFLFLDPQYGWHGGFNWWNRKLAGVIREFADSIGDFAKARRYLAERMASIEAIPYHSSSSTHALRRWRQMPSVKLAVSFVRDVVLPQAQAGRALVVVMRKKDVWGLKRAKNVVVYDGNEARSAHLSLNSPAGPRILEFLRTDL